MGIRNWACREVSTAAAAAPPMVVNEVSKYRPQPLNYGLVQASVMPRPRLRAADRKLTRMMRVVERTIAREAKQAEQGQNGQVQAHDPCGPSSAPTKCQRKSPPSR